MVKIKYFIFFVLLLSTVTAYPQAAEVSDSVRSERNLVVKGQLSLWGGYISGANLPVITGARYLPQLNLTIKPTAYRRTRPDFEFEIAANLYGNGSIEPFNRSQWGSDLKLYRGWGKISTEKAELRVGLQKINFGSASILRPLMWFDRVDARDPLQFTDGVWGALGRYYFKDNSNIWLWALYGNKESRPWDVGTTSGGVPEFGGRVQIAVPGGEAAFTFHHRKSDLEAISNIPENRYAFDIKLDVVVGLWLEAVWVNKSVSSGIFTNQEMINVGTDYTFGIGNGLNVIAEHLILSYDEKPFRFSNKINMSAVSMSYPAGISDNLGYIAYYDWENGGMYNFINWRHDFNRFKLHLMGYINPKSYNLPVTGNNTALYSGSGFQIMLVYNHQNKMKFKR